MQPLSMEETLSSDPENSSVNSNNEKRKSSKPVMEKRRRARINNSLNELKEILLESMKKDSTRHSKLEKADILEMTVKHLKNVERQRLSVALSIDPSVVDKYKSGFNECRNEVMRFLSTSEGVNVDVRTRLLDHLENCHQSLQSSANSYSRDVYGDQPTRRSPIKLAPCAPQNHMQISAINLDHAHQTFQMQLPVSSTGSIQIPSNMTTAAGLTLNPTRQIHQVNAPHVTPVLLKGNLQIAPKQFQQNPTHGNITVIMPSSQIGQATAYLSPVSIANQYQTVELVTARPLEMNYNVPDVVNNAMLKTQHEQSPKLDKGAKNINCATEYSKIETKTKKVNNALKRKQKKQTATENKKSKVAKSTQNQTIQMRSCSTSSNDEGTSPDKKLMTSSYADITHQSRVKSMQSCDSVDVNNNNIADIKPQFNSTNQENNSQVFFRDDEIIRNDVSPWRPWSFATSANDITAPVTECSK